MNERILKLAEQAQKEVWGNNPYNGSPEFEGYELDAEKFAELIIKECDSIIEKYSKANMESDSWVAMTSMMQKELKQHFGVEE